MARARALHLLRPPRQSPWYRVPGRLPGRPRCPHPRTSRSRNRGTFLARVPRDRCQPLPALGQGRLRPIRALPLSLGPPAHRSSDGRLEPNGREPGFYEVQDEPPCASPLRLCLPKPPHAALRLCPPLTLPRARTILPEQPNSRIHRGNLRHESDAPSLPEPPRTPARRLTIPKAHSLRSSGSVQQILSAMLPHSG